MQNRYCETKGKELIFYGKWWKETKIWYLVGIWMFGEKGCDQFL
jgi:hypothetical protein